jgi:hypothetical protein
MALLQQVALEVLVPSLKCAVVEAEELLLRG